MKGIYIELLEDDIKRIDTYIKNNPYSNRSDFIRKAISNELKRLSNG